MQKLDKPLKDLTHKYRYFCPACTGIAFTSDKREVMLAGECKACGTPYMTKLENYILNK